ncbi:MAG: peptidoglycan-binding protein [Patescibacteria group bacterium]
MQFDINSAMAADSGFQNPTANAAVTSGAGDNNGYQTSPTNAYADGGGTAIDSNSGSNTNDTCASAGADKHIWSNFNFNIPLGSSIDGIELRQDLSVDSLSDSPFTCVALSWDGGTTWTAYKIASLSTTSETTYTFGNGTDNWGRSWSGGELSNANFRVMIANGDTNNARSRRDFSLDWIAPKIYYTPPTLNQSGYRLFNNADSANVGSPLAALNSAAQLSSGNDNFRLRLLLHDSGVNLPLAGDNFKLQYVDKGVGTCAAPSGGTPASYTDVTAATAIAYSNNPTPADGSALIANANDPSHGADAVINQTYEELNNFTNSQAPVAVGQDGLWDFSLKDNTAPDDKTYCFRVVKSDGSLLNAYSVYPEIMTAEGPPVLMSVVASDPDNWDSVLSNWDRLTLLFNKSTNAPQAGTKTQIDGLINFANPLGANYSGIWQTTNFIDDTLRITVISALGGSLNIGNLISIIADGTEDLKNQSETSPASTTSGNVTGNWGFQKAYYACDAVDQVSYMDVNLGASSKTLLGNLGAANVEAIVYDYNTQTLYGANAGQLGTINQSTGAFSALPNPIGSGNGSLGVLAFNDVDGLAFDPWTSVLYGTVRRDPGKDLLIKINPATGARIANAFGTGVDYVVIDETGVFDDVDDISINPLDDKMYTIGNQGHLTEDQLLIINKLTGAISVQANFGIIPGYDIEGMAFSSDGRMWGTRGVPNELVQVIYNTNPPTITGNVSLAPGCGDPEGIDFQITSTNTVTGRVWDDLDTDGVLDGGEPGLANVTVRLYKDLNSNGLADSLDLLIQSKVTDVSGNYTFKFLALDDFVLEIDDSSLPSGYGLTTDNLEVAAFTSMGELDENNNFGAVAGSDCDGDGIPDFIQGVGINDFDGDTVIDSCDLDVDNDGILNAMESSNDRDGDSIPNFRDVDSDNDGIPDAREANSGVAPTGYNISLGYMTGTDTDGDGLLDQVDSLPAVQYGASASTLPIPNTDSDAVRDFLDGDSDNDGILDIIEAGGADSDGDGEIDSFTDVNGDGYHDPLNTSPLPLPNTDISGKPNYLDLDSDGDGLPDFREGQSTASYHVPLIISDADGNGIIDAYDKSAGGNPIVPVDTDSDGIPDYRDLDTDNDSLTDISIGEGHASATLVGADTDSDGIDNGFDTNNSPSYYFLNNTAVTDNPPPNTFGTSEYNWREFDAVPSADLSLDKLVDNSAPNVGDTITYTITVSNAGPNNATNVSVVDLLPAGVTYSSATPSQGSYNNISGVWTVGTINNGSTASLQISATVNVGTGNSTISNSAQVSASDQADPDSTPNNNMPLEDDQDSDDIDVQAADLSLVKIVDNVTPNVGDIVKYTITVSNGGPDTATNAVVKDILPVGVTYSSDNPSQGSYNSGTGLWTIGTINNGANAVLEINADVDTGTGGTTIDNTAEVYSVDQEDPDSTPDNNVPAEDDQSSVSITVESADVAITKTDAADPVTLGNNIQYDVTVTNNGPSDATNVDVTDTLPAGVTYVSATPSQGSCSELAGTVTCNLNTINNGNSATITIIVTPTSSGSFTNNISVTATESDPTPGNNSDSEDTTVGDVADLSLTKTVDISNPNVGDMITYTITVSNAGAGNATGVSVKDILPAGVTYSSDTPSQGTYNSVTGVWTLGSIANGASAILQISAIVDAGSAGSSIANIAQVSASDQPDPDSTPNNNAPAEDDQDSASITVQSADLSLTKTVDNAAPNEGDTIQYTIILNNSGPDNAENVSVKDLLPVGVTYSFDIPSQGTYDSITGIWNIGNVIGLASATLQISATVDIGSAGIPIVNTAEVIASDQEDPDSTPNNDVPAEDDQDSVIINSSGADLELTKTDSIDPIYLGSNILYNIAVLNNGPADATGVIATDSLPAGVTYVSATPSQGACAEAAGMITCNLNNISNGSSATIAITVIPLSDGIYANSASVSASESDPLPANNSDNENTTVDPVSDLSLTKIIDNNNPSIGNSIKYTLTLLNSGPSQATNVFIKDLLPAGLTYVGNTPSQGTYDSLTGEWTVGVVNSGASATLEVSATVNSGTAGQVINNTGEVIACDQHDSDSTPNNNLPAEDDQASVSLTVKSGGGGGGGGGGGSVPPAACVAISGANSSLKINNGAEKTDSLSVLLNLSYSTATSVMFSENSDFTGASSQPVSGSLPFSLSSGAGEKKVYAKLSNQCSSVTVADTILYELPESEECIVNCDQITYKLYIVNPDGTERHAGTNYVQQEQVADGIVLYKFEDKGLDFDYNDVFVQVDDRNCSGVKFSVTRELEASWHHQIGVNIFYQGKLSKHILLWSDSHTSFGNERTYDFSTDQSLCEESIEPIEEPEIEPEPEVPVECVVDCDKVKFDLFIVNPDGTERHSGTRFVEEEKVSDGVILYKFEDKGEDFDYNDVFVQVDRRDCANVIFSVTKELEASWHHQIKVRLSGNGIVGGAITLWPDSHMSFGNERSLDVSADQSLCQQCVTDCQRVTYDLYIVNPDGTERRMNSRYAQIEDQGNGVILVKFEDKGNDFDYNDVLIKVDKSTCEIIKVTSLQLEAGWHHQIKIKLLYDGIERNDVLLWADSHLSVDQSKEVNLTDYSRLCEVDLLDKVEQAAVTVFEHINFLGRSQTFVAGQKVPELTVFSFNNLISSVKIVGNAAVDFFTEALYSGRSERFSQDDFDLRNNSIGNDTVTSLQVSLRAQNIPSASAAALRCGGNVVFSEMTAGDQGSNVVSLQELLKCLGFFPQGQPATGYFGPVTENALKNFQLSNGIEPSGYLDQATLSAINDL